MNTTRPLAYAAALLMGAGSLIAAETKSSLNATDEKFVKEASMDGKAEVRLGQLGAGKADDKAVKAVAEMMIKDHTMANGELEALAKSKGVELSAANDPKSDKMIASLEKDSGKDFDKAFLKQLEKDHKKDISSFESESKDAKDGELKAWVDKTLPTLKGHLDHVKTTLKGK
ncbi:MAG: outer membrane protein-like protein [Verrucomicrobiaceae bacterium]|nr:outer membrane protein-like protein [Verrucomicrobiaceae bacterium]